MFIVLYDIGLRLYVLGLCGFVFSNFSCLGWVVVVAMGGYGREED